MTSQGHVGFLGAIGKQGVYPYRPARLKNAIETAGGLNKNADRGRIVVLRGGLFDEASAYKIPCDYNKVLKGQAADIALLPGDVVMVPVHKKSDLGSKIRGWIGGAAKPLAPLLKRLAPLSRTITKALPGINPVVGSMLGVLTRRPQSGRSAGTVRLDADLQADKDRIEVLRRLYEVVARTGVDPQREPIP